MTDFSNFDPNVVSNPNNNIFGLPTSEEDARVIILPVPWEVTVSYGSGTARAPEAILKSSLQVDLFDPDLPEGWKQGYYMRPIDRKLLMKSDYLRKEAELYIDYISRGEDVSANQFMYKTMKDVNDYARKTVQYAMLNAEKYFRQGKKASWFKIRVSPAFTFVNYYLLKLGFLDGHAGYICARMTAWYTFLKYARLKELGNIERLNKQ